MKYARVALGLPIDEVFDYLIPEHLSKDCSAGCRVGVSFGRRDLIGYLVGISLKTKIKKIKPINRLIDSKPILDKNFLKLTEMVSDYYFSSWGQAIEAALPADIRRGLAVSISETGLLPLGIFDVKGRNDSSLGSNDNSHKVTFLRGGSIGERLKAYEEQIDRVLAQRKSIIVLSPEVKQCLNILDLLKKNYSDRIELACRKHNPKEDLGIWEKAKNGIIDILVGTRAAVFAPFINLGLIIIEHEDAYGYKDERSPYYHARDVALMRAQLENIPLVLSSNTPSLESYYALKRKKYSLANIADKDAGQGVKITIADMRQYGQRQKTKMLFSPVLEDKLHKAIQSGKKILIFINRKGYAGFVYCQKCGYIVTCDKCSLRLIFYFEEKKLVCNSCGFKKTLPELCPECNANYIRFKGYGIEKLISQLHLVFPQAKISRIDKEHTDLNPDAQILVATEMVFHCDWTVKVEVVGAINLDTALNIVNFRSNEKLYALILRLKSLASEELIIQTVIPEFFSRIEIANLEIDKLYAAELKERKALKLPPFVHLIMLRLRGKNLQRAQNSSMDLYEKLKNINKSLEVFEPIEAIPLKLRGWFRFNILLKVSNPLALSKLLKKRLKEIRLPGTKLSVEVDPQ